MWVSTLRTNRKRARWVNDLVGMIHSTLKANIHHNSKLLHDHTLHNHPYRPFHPHLGMHQFYAKFPETPLCKVQQTIQSIDGIKAVVLKIFTVLSCPRTDFQQLFLVCFLQRHKKWERSSIFHSSMVLESRS